MNDAGGKGGLPGSQVRHDLFKHLTYQGRMKPREKLSDHHTTNAWGNHPKWKWNFLTNSYPYIPTYWEFKLPQTITVWDVYLPLLSKTGVSPSRESEVRGWRDLVLLLMDELIIAWLVVNVLSTSIYLQSKNNYFWPIQPLWTNARISGIISIAYCCTPETNATL